MVSTKERFGEEFCLICTYNLIKRKNVPTPRHKFRFYCINSNNTYKKCMAQKEKTVVL